MVQMKVPSDDEFSIKEQLLYIPHGSDERTNARDTALLEVFFISHMVQMKASLCLMTKSSSPLFISHMVQMKD